jgi:ribose transport system permease protein
MAVPESGATNISEDAPDSGGSPAGRPRFGGPRFRRGSGVSRSKAAAQASNYGVLGFTILLIIVFAVALPSQFPTSGNVKSLLGDQAIPGILAFAAMLPLAAGEFDLSIAANLGFTSVASAYFASKGMDWPFVVLLSLGIGALIGCINGFLVVGVGINAFIATLGMSTILEGGNLWVTNGNTIYQGIGTSFTNISTTSVDGVEIIFVYFLIVAVILWYVLERTPYGRYIRATGLGRNAARLSGVKTSRYLFSSFVLAGLLSGLCGVLETALTGSASASVGPDFLLPAFAAAFLGQTTIKQGMFNVWGTIVGLALLAIGINGLTLAGAPYWLPYVFNGVALIVSVAASILVARSRRGEGR